ncbi:hypothetical protein DFH27DRAFT_4118 [Peziza echinospora]|nr:hypothetical protein DFH27DRAFT_4118 [Peziza echinospora]
MRKLHHLPIYSLASPLHIQIMLAFANGICFHDAICMANRFILIREFEISQPKRPFTSTRAPIPTGYCSPPLSDLRLQTKEKGRKERRKKYGIRNEETEKESIWGWCPSHGMIWFGLGLIWLGLEVQDWTWPW